MTFFAVGGRGDSLDVGRERASRASHLAGVSAILKSGSVAF